MAWIVDVLCGFWQLVQAGGCKQDIVSDSSNFGIFGYLFFAIFGYVPFRRSSPHPIPYNRVEIVYYHDRDPVKFHPNGCKI